MARLGKIGRIRLAMSCTFLLAFGCLGCHFAAPYFEGKASADSVMEFRGDSEADQAALLAVDREMEVAESTRLEADGKRPADSPEPNGDAIDWEGLRDVNPDVVGWLSVAGTRIDYPVVQAQPQDPQHYLHYDIMHAPSPYGCPYLDVDAIRQGGLCAPFAVIYGHHLINGQMFSDFAKFADEPYAREHASILMDTPEETIRLRAIAVNIVDADEELIQTSFVDARELTDYLNARLAESEVVLEHAEDAVYHQAFCFVTCSYGSENERTLVYAIPEDEE